MSRSVPRSPHASGGRDIGAPRPTPVDEAGERGRTGGDGTPSRRAVSTSRDVAVRLEGLVKRFRVRRSWTEMLRHPFGGGEVTVLRDVDLEIRRGEFFGLLGPNGAGKTTLFKVLATLVLPDAGRATVAGYDVVSRPAEVRARLAPVIGDERSLYWRLTGDENLRLFAALYGLDRTDGRRRSRELLEVVGLDGTGTKLVGEYSSGMKQRLLLARALLSQPEVLLLDEPTRSLDPLSARDFRTFLREKIGDELGCTVILATHDTEEALELCERVAVLDGGRVRAVGTADELQAAFGDERYRVRARGVEERALRWLQRSGAIAGYRIGPADGDGWIDATLSIPGGLDEASAVLSSLTRGGATVAGFERVSLPLAELMGRIVAAGAAREDGGDRPGAIGTIGAARPDTVEADGTTGRADGSPSIASADAAEDTRAGAG